MPFMIHAEVDVAADQMQLLPATITVTETPIEVPVARIALYALSGVELHRQLEIFTGWEFLWNGIRDRNLLDSAYVGSLLYTYTDINKKGEADRRTSSLLVDLATTDIAVALGSSVTARASGAVLPLETAFDQLRGFAKSEYFVAA